MSAQDAVESRDEASITAKRCEDDRSRKVGRTSRLVTSQYQCMKNFHRLPYSIHVAPTALFCGWVVGMGDVWRTVHDSCLGNHV
jgi:hypothetical protein